MEEIWKEYTTRGAVFEVSNTGKVRPITEGATVGIRTAKTKRGYSYKYVDFYFNGKQAGKGLAKTVFNLFSETKTDHVSYLDGDYRNCSFDNLTPRTSYGDGKEAGLNGERNSKTKTNLDRTRGQKKRSKRTKNSGEEVLKLNYNKEIIAVFQTVKEAAASIEQSHFKIGEAIRKKTRCGGFYWDVRKKEDKKDE